MSPPRNVTSRASELKYEAILDAALELFVEHGFNGTAVPAVAERAHVGAGTIYRYFENKEALVNALYRRWKTAISQLVLDGFPVDAEPRAQFHTIWTKLTAFAKDHPKAFAFLELHHHASYLDEQSKAIENQLLEFATGFISHAQDDGVLKPGKPMLLMSLVYGAFTGIVRASWEGRLDLTDEDLERAEQICWQAISQ